MRHHRGKSVCVCVWVGGCVCLFVCVCERERERGGGGAKAEVTNHKRFIFNHKTRPPIGRYQQYTRDPKRQAITSQCPAMPRPKQRQRIIGHNVNVYMNTRHRQKHKVGPCVPTRRGIARQRETPRDPTRQETAWRFTSVTAPTACVTAPVAPLQQLLLPHACPRTRRNSGLPSGMARCL
jgi:hypothetical protein